ncbi:MAG: hypothetical protein Q9221_007403 [Calogaya cf. arnoldii]
MPDYSTIGTSFQVLPSLGSRWQSNDTSKAYVANFEMVGYQPSSKNDGWYTIGTDILASTPLIATKCALWFCVRSYQHRMLAGNKLQKVRGRFSEVLPMEGTTVDTMNQTFLPLPPTMNPRPGANFTVSYLAKSSMLSFLRKNFDGNITLFTDTQESSADIITAMWPATQSTRSIDDWIENVAASMTDGIWTTDQEPDDYCKGSGFQLAYHVRWGWIMPPVALLLASLLVLTLAMMQTRRRSIQAWKGSPLALLLISPETSPQRMVDSRASAYKGYEKAMGETMIGIEKEEDKGWVLKERT